MSLNNVLISANVIRTVLYNSYIPNIFKVEILHSFLSKSSHVVLTSLLCTTIPMSHCVITLLVVLMLLDLLYSYHFGLRGDCFSTIPCVRLVFQRAQKRQPNDYLNA